MPPPPTRALLPASAKRLAAELVEWFDVHKRDLPWRTDRTPYRVWLSEVMLQQTRVSVVEEYFKRFVARFPDPASLARAHEDEVLSLWSGLGYYSRGRNLHAAARAVVEEHGGVFPSTSAALATLPGVGPYTAAAVASLAFGEATAVVDGNVGRVIARLANDAEPVDTPAGRERVRGRAQLLVDATDRPAAVNEALMELGALVCTPRSASCDACPWRRSCAARSAGTVDALPKKSPKRPRKALRVASVVFVDEKARVWLEKRPGRGLFGGLYEPPSREVAGDVDAAWRELVKERGARAPNKLPPPVLVERTLTHRDLSFAVARLDVTSADVRDAPDVAGAWIDDPRTVGVSTAVRAVLEAVSAWPRAEAPSAGSSRTRRRAQPSSSRARRLAPSAGSD
jgi:A/G-specific adenine glycosylase